MNDPILSVADLAVEFDTYGGTVQAVRGVSFDVHAGETLAIVGESGCGKSVTVQSIMGLIPMPPGRITSGTAKLYGTDIIGRKTINGEDIRGDKIGMIFQDPMTSLNPTMNIGSQIAETLIVHRGYSRKQAFARAIELLDMSKIPEPAKRAKQYPFEFSGGMLQRAMIAMAIACGPDVLIADEPTTALDVTIQAQILELLRKLQHEKQMAIMLITHDLGVVAENADVVAVMYSGRIVEYASVFDIFDRPMHPYTKGLLKSMPVLGRRVDRLPTVMDGAIVENFPAGYTCAPHIDQQNPEGGYGGPDARLYEVAENHWVLCTKEGGPAEDPPAPKLDYIREDALAGS